MTKKLMQGNEAIAEGAIVAGLSFFAAYPITPASEIMHRLSRHEGKIKYVHAEDEIASINMVLGASLAGKKSMTSSSGPGLSLKQEAIGMAHMVEIPTVIVNVMRVGPSTGMPTLPSQGDIMQVKYGTHGDVYPIAFYPNSVEECYKYTIEAFNAAEEAMCPVFLLCDGFIGHLYEAIDIDNINIKTKYRSKKPLGSLEKRHFTGLLSKNGKPATKNTKYYREWIRRIKSKIKKVSKKYQFYEYLENKDSNTLIISYGITSRVIADLKEKYSIFRPITIFPILKEKISKISQNYKNIICIEMNDGQYGREIQSILKRDVMSVPILGGNISAEDVKSGITHCLKNNGLDNSKTKAKKKRTNNKIKRT